MNEDPGTPPSDDDARAGADDASPFLQAARSAAAELPASPEPMIFAVAHWAQAARQPDDIQQLFGICEMAVSIMTQHAQGERFPTLGASLDLRLHLAIVLDMGRQWALSIALLEPAVRELEALMADYPDNVSPMLARLLGRQGQAWMRQHQPEEALPRLERALTLHRSTAELEGYEEPTETMADLLLDGGVALISASRVREAADWFGEAGRLYLELLTYPESKPEWSRRVVSAFLNQAQAMRQADRHAEAMQPLQQAWSILAPVAALRERAAEVRRALWQAESLAKTYAAWGDLSRRAAMLEVAVAAAEALAKVDPDGMAAQLAWLTTHLGASRSALGDFVGGALTLQLGCTRYRKLVEAQTRVDMELGTAFVDALRITASVLTAAGQLDKGLAFVDDAAGVLEKLQTQGQRLARLAISVRLVAARIRWMLFGASAMDNLLARLAEDFDHARTEGLPNDPDDWAMFKMLEGLALLETSRISDARHCFEQALASFASSPVSTPAATHNSMQALLKTLLALTIVGTRESDRARLIFEKVLAEQKVSSDPITPLVRRTAKLGLARLLMMKGRLRECARLSVEATQELGEQAGSYLLQMTQVEVATLHGTALLMDGTHVGMVQALNKLNEAAEPLGDQLRRGHLGHLFKLNTIQILQSIIMVELGHAATAIRVLTDCMRALRDAEDLSAMQAIWYGIALSALGEARQRVEGCNDEVLTILNDGIAFDSALAEHLIEVDIRPQVALKHLRLAELLAQSGRVEQAEVHEDRAAAILFAMQDCGDWPDEEPLVRMTVRLVPRWWKDAIDGAESASRCLTQLTRVAAMLRLVEADDRQLGNARGHRVLMLLNLLEQLQGPRPADTNCELVPLYDSLFTTALTWTRLLLRDSDPHWLQANRALIDRLIGGLQHIAIAFGSQAVARWFLCTQGLRSQRAALYEQHDRTLTGLKQCWDEIDQLSRLYMGASNPGGSPIAMLMPTRSLLTLALNSPTEDVQTRLTAAFSQKDRLQRELECQGHIVLDPALELEDIHARLRPNQALLLLAPLGKTESPGEGVAILLRSEQDTVGQVETRQLTIDPGGLIVEPGLWPAGNGDARARRMRQLRHRTTSNSDGVADSPLNNGNPSDYAGPTSLATVRLATAGLPTDPDWEFEGAAMLELLNEIKLKGVRELAIVPSGSWHSVPWGQLLSRHELRTHLLPSVGTWWRLTTTIPANSLGYSPPRRRRRVALLPHDARHESAAGAWLPWVAVEAVLSRMLWPSSDGVQLHAEDPTWLPDDAALRIHTLVGMGHGHGQAENPASAGLWLGSDEERAPRLLNAQNLGHIDRVRALVLSCCVLGRTEARFGEPMGMAADAFAHGVRVVLGALIPLPDLDAMLLSLACQWAMRTSDPDRVRTHAVLHESLSMLRQGAWPAGFGAWLRTHLASAVCQVMDDRATPDAFAQTLWRCALAEADFLGLDLACWQRPSIDDAGLANLAQALAAAPPASTRQAAGWLVLLGSDPLEDDAPE